MRSDFAIMRIYELVCFRLFHNPGRAVVIGAREGFPYGELQLL